MATVFQKSGTGPYIIRWLDETGRKKEQSSRTTDMRAAKRIAAKIQAEVELRREGVHDPALARAADANALPLSGHVAAYLAHLAAARRSPHTITAAEHHLAWIQDNARASRLSDLTLDRVTAALALLLDQDKSARTVNYYGGSVQTFLGWCVKTGRLPSNPLRFLPRHAEATDRRRERRALTDKELASLFAVARARGRELYYALAYYAGLRRSELERMTWGDVDLERGVVRVPRGKAKRLDEVPIHAALAPLLARPGGLLPSARVFPRGRGSRALGGPPTNTTRRRDFKAAGMDVDKPDERGRVVDLHSLRATLATNLALRGVAPQLAMKLMRHADYRTTLKHYTVLRLEDTAAALAALGAPAAPAAAEVKA